VELDALVVLNSAKREFVVCVQVNQDILTDTEVTIEMTVFLGLDLLRFWLYLQEAQGFSHTQSKSRLVYDYSKHSSQGNGNGEVSPVKTCRIAGPASSSKHEDKLATMQDDTSVTQADAVKLLPIQVGNMAEGAFCVSLFWLLINLSVL
jgi:hypothetical protein